MTQRAGSSNNGNDKSEPIIDFNSVREKRLSEKRKNTERFFFRNLLSVYTVTEHGKLVPVELIELSEEGCSVQIPYDPEVPWPTSVANLTIRFYFSREMYLEIFVNIRNSSHSIDGNKRFLRMGCTVDVETKVYPAYQQFVKFIKLYSEHAHKDNGNNTVFYI